MILLLILPLFLCISFAAERVLVSAYPFYDVVSLVGGERYRVEVLVPPRADYHLYELTPKDLLKLARSRLFFTSGVPLGGWEEKAERVFRGRVIHLSEGLDLISEGSARDPHLWLSPALMKGVARNAYRGFSEADPAGAESYRRNLEALLRELSALDGEFRKALSRCRYRVLPVVHPALGYLARDYGLIQISLSGADVHGDVSPAELTAFVEELKRRKVSFLLVPSGERTKLAELLSEEYGLRLYEINIRIVPEGGREDYFSVMRGNLSVLREALQCR